MSDPFVGEIRIFSGTIVPTGWALCDGRILQIAPNTALFSLLYNYYGGDGKTTFALPNLLDAAPMQCGKGINLSERKIGERGGAATVTLSVENMPDHIHRAASSSSAGSQSNPTDLVWGAGGEIRGGVPLYSETIGASMNIEALSETGGEQPHNNMPPFVGVQYIIALQGVYPPRPPQ
jgi:microcystin-dependent protein